MGQDLKAWREVSLCDFDILYLAHALIYKSDDLGITDVWIVEKGKLTFIDLYAGSVQYSKECLEVFFDKAFCSSGEL